ncbi:MAG: hypothetical protein U0936_16810 [Planctomycetaceae bacterium]
MEDIRIGVQEVFYVILVQFIQMAIAGYGDDLVRLVAVSDRARLSACDLVHQLSLYKRLERCLYEICGNLSVVLPRRWSNPLLVSGTQGFVREQENATVFGELAADYSRLIRESLKTQGTFR